MKFNPTKKLDIKKVSKSIDYTNKVAHTIPEFLNQSDRWSEQDFKKLFEGCADIKIMRHDLNEPDDQSSMLLIYCEGLADSKQINEYVIKHLKPLLNRPSTDLASIELDLKRFDHIEEVISRVFSGQLVIYQMHTHKLLTLDIANPPQRTPEESSTELSIKGPRDGFVEDLTTNVALVRKRLRTNALRYEPFTIGKQSRCKVALLYIQELVKPEWIEEAKQRLNNVEIEALFSSTQLGETISDNPYSMFPLIAYTGRPDYVVDCLIHGRFAIIVDEAPLAIIAPVNFTFLLKSPEDIYSSFYIVAFEMLIRISGLMIALFLPGFWVALTSYNMEQIPFPLLATIALTRMGLPIPGPLEAFIMIGLFELFREAGMRLPKAVGQTIAVVGGIIIGDAVIRAGLASTTMLIVAALTAVATFTLVDQNLNSSVTIIRLFVLITSSVLGMYGFIITILAVVLYLSKLESFGVPYLSPLSPLKRRDIWGALFRLPPRKKRYPLSFLQKK